MTADTRYVTTIRCNEPGCKRRFRLPWDHVFTRKKAAAEGWSYTGMPHYRDLCPDHSPVNDQPARSED